MIEYDRGPDADWRRAAEERIERHRKGDLTVVVEGTDGEPVEDAAVRVDQRRRAVDFGSAIDARTMMQDDADGERYREFVAGLDRVTFENDLKWRPWAAAQDDPDRMATLEAAVDWLHERDVPVRGHYVTWAVMEGGSVPEAVFEECEGDPAALADRWEENVADRVPAADDLVDPIEWDVINHPVGWSDEADALGDEHSFEFYEAAFEWAERYAPDAGHWINEDNMLNDGRNSDDYAAVVEDLLDRGVGVDGIGFMCHFEEPELRHPDELVDVLDRFADLVPHLQITELDVFVDDPGDAADYFADVLRVAYSHPAMEAVVLWGFWAGRHWRPSAALFDEEWNLTAIGEAWQDCLAEWWTETTVTTDAGGTAEVHGDTGTYDLTVEIDGESASETVELPPAGTTVTVSPT